MKKAYIFLATGFEETEAITTADILCRGGIETYLVSIYSDTKVIGAHGIEIEAHKKLSKIDFSDADALILPGGQPGSNNLNECKPLRKALLNHYQLGKLVAAICAAPLVLGELEILDGRRATCYPGFESYLKGAILTKGDTVTDGNIITGRGPGLTIPFGAEILKSLEGEEKATEVLKGMLYNHPSATTI